MDFYRNRGTRAVVSFELFPPKNEEAVANLHRILPELVALRPDFMTVTYGALGSTQERTLDTAAHILHRFNMPVACHLTCVGASKAKIDRTLRDIHAMGIRNIVALRGDPPRADLASYIPPEDGLHYANELVAHIRQFEQRYHKEPFGIAVAGYPETHIEAPDAATDLANLKRKVDAGADIVITQLFYNNEDFFRFEREARAIGIACPIIPGLLPITSAKQLLRIASLCGSRIPPDLQRELEGVREHPEAAEEIGIRVCVEQARALLAHGAPGLHFYVLNRSGHIRRIMEQLA